jgi:adenine-specific DNA-methyltransferase
MERLTMSSKDLTQENIEKMGRLFPNVITEVKDENGNITCAIDFELLQQELNDEIVEGEKERYQLTWPGKKEAILMANTPINKTLTPVKEDSLNWEDTENLYIEGDNLEVLKLLQESYLSKVKCIYIDPPYNTGKDFIYRDKFTQDKDEYLEESGQVDEEGNRLFQNTEYNGRYHSDWLTMMYPRLKLARNLLAEDGVIFISIDDNEVHNLRKICDEVFGERNFISVFTWKRRSGANDAKNNVSIDHEYVVTYAKSFESELKGISKEFENYRNPDKDPRGEWVRGDLTCGKTASQRPNLFYPITDPKTGIVYESDPSHVWRFEKNRMDELIRQGKVLFPENGTGRPAYKRHRSEIRSDTKPFSSILQTRLNAVATRELRELFGVQVFDYSKTVDLIRQLCNQVTQEDSIILDFFSGSATTAHAVMQLNAEDGGNRKYIMVQLPEPTDEASEAYKAGYKNIAELGKERIRRAGEKIKEETGAGIDYGFRVFKVDSTNMKNVYYRPDQLEQTLLDELNSV